MLYKNLNRNVWFIPVSNLDLFFFLGVVSRMLSQAKDDGPAGTSTSLKSFSETATTILGGCTCRVAFTTIFFEAIRGLWADNLLQHLQYQPAHCSSSEGQLILPRQCIIQPAVLNQNALYWCNICQVKCENAFNLKQHYQSEAHCTKRKWTYKNKSTMPNGNKML